jgi:hypothetical protein
MTQRRDRGSALMLMPAALLVVFVLGSIALEFAVVSMRQRALANAADAAANDAATVAIDAGTLRATGEVVLDPQIVVDVIGRSLRAQGVELAAAPVIEISPDGRSIRLELVQRVPYVIARALPGDDGTTVRAVVRATTVETS